MQFSIKSTALPSTPASCLVAGIFDDGQLSEAAEIIDKASGKAISKMIRAGDIKGKSNQSLLLHDLPGIKAKRVLLLGLGKKKDWDLKKYAEALRHCHGLLKKYSLADATIALADKSMQGGDTEKQAQMLARIMLTAQYHYTATRSKDKNPTLLRSDALHLADSSERSKARRGLDTGIALAGGMNLARELGNLPGNVCTPTYLATQAQALAKKHRNLSTKVLSEAQMKRLGMGALLSVSAGSAEPASFIIMEYKGGKGESRPHVIVGKGITFDTGGISLKPGAGMDEMKFDMCGAASVLGTMQAICELQPAKHIIGIIASAENMPGSKATKPGDIVTSMSGQTIEILNTDAEGRLVLCDALTYVERYKPKSVIDIATLTGACIVALGNDISALISNDDELAGKLFKCSEEALDPVWHMPLWEPYQKQLHSNFADIANIGGKAGTLTAACFLSRFTKKYKWAHLDIAGTAWEQGQRKGATGRPVPLLLEYLLSA